MLIGFQVRHYAMLHQTKVGMDWQEISENAALIDKDLGNGRIFPLQQMTALVGRNSTGKSSLIDALSFVADCLKYDVPFAATLNGRGGFSKLVTHGSDHCASFSLIFHHHKKHQFIKYYLSIGCDDHGRPFVKAEQVSQLRIVSEKAQQSAKKEKSDQQQPDKEHGAAAKHTIDEQHDQYQMTELLSMENGQGRIYNVNLARYEDTELNDLKHPALAAYGMLREYEAFSYLYKNISRWYFCRHGKPDDHRPGQHSSGGHKHLNHACDNIENVLQYYQHEYPTYYQDMIDRLSDKINENGSADEAFYDGSMTSGSLKLFTYLLLLEDPEPRALICLEEPESGLYHDMVEVLAKAMRDYTLKHTDCQILFVTHSPFLLEAMHPDEIWVFRRKKMLGPKISGYYAQAFCAGENAVIRAMHDQGVGMSAIWYGGHFDDDQDA